MPTPYCDRGPMFLEPKKATSRVALPIPTRNRTRRHRMAIVSEERTKKEGRKEGRSANQASLPSFSPLLVPLQVLLRELSSLLTRLPLLSGLKILSLFIPTSAIKGKPERRARAVPRRGAPSSDRYHQTDKTTTTTKEVLNSALCMERATEGPTGWHGMARLSSEREGAL